MNTSISPSNIRSFHKNTGKGIARNSALALLLSVSVAGCATKQEIVDNSPIVRSATVVSSVTNGGIKGQFASAGKRTVKTVSDMRREDEAFKFTGSIMSRIGKSADASHIIRLDRALVYQLNNKKKPTESAPSRVADPSSTI